MKFLIFYITLLFSSSMFAQTIGLEWEKVYGGSQYEKGNSIIKITDSAFLVLGYTRSLDGDVTTNLGSSDIWVIKVGYNGEILWQKSYGGSESETGESISKTLDGGFIVGGYSYSNDGHLTENKGYCDGWVVNLDSDGNVMWQISVGGSDEDRIKDIVQSSNDSSFIFVGSTTSVDGDLSANFGGEDIFVGKISKYGELLWVNNFGNVLADDGNELVSDSLGNIYVCGTQYFVSSSEFYLLKISPGGNLIWEKNYGGTDYDDCWGLCLTDNNRIYLIGSVYSHDGDVTFHYPGIFNDLWLIAIDSTGQLLWDKTLGGSVSDFGHSIVPNGPNSLLIAGGSSTPNNGDVTGHHGFEYTDFWVLNVDTLGELKWAHCFGGTDVEIAFAIAPINETSVMVTGVTYSFDGDVSFHYPSEFYTGDIWVTKINELCSVIPYYADEDDDEYGDPNNYTYSCEAVDGYVLDNTDCDDDNPFIYPGASEILNGLDDDCNQLIDDDVAITDNIDIKCYVYPNPAKDVITVTKNSNATGTFKIISSTGQVVLSGVIENAQNIINVSSIPAGIFTIHIHFKDNIAANSFVKL